MSEATAVVENLRRSAQYLALMEERRSQLRHQLVEAIPPGSSFVWEVGCGHGHFLAAYAQAHPEKLCLGIDIASDRIARAQRKRDRAAGSNLHFFHAEAGLFLDTLPAGTSIADSFILFPDPWPKQRHQKHRILQPKFLDQLAAHARSGCRLCFRTDFGPYFEGARAAIMVHPQWEVVAEAWPFEFATVFQSRAASFHSLIARRR